MKLHQNRALKVDFPSDADWRACSYWDWKWGTLPCISGLQEALAALLDCSIYDVKAVFIPTRSCTDALSVAGQLLNVTKLPAFTYNATYAAGADLETPLEEPPDPKQPWLHPPGVELVVEMYGIPYPLLTPLFTKDQVKVLDAAHSLIGPRHLRFLGGRARRAVCFSFGPLKLANLPLGGGLLVHPNIHQQAWSMLNCGVGTDAVGPRIRKGLLELPWYEHLANRLWMMPRRAERLKELYRRLIDEVLVPRGLTVPREFQHASGHLGVIQLASRGEAEWLARRLKDAGVDTSYHYGERAKEAGLLSVPLGEGLNEDGLRKYYSDFKMILEDRDDELLAGAHEPQ